MTTPSEAVEWVMKEAAGPPSPPPLEAVREYITRYVSATSHQIDAITLWVAHTHAFDAAETTPYISLRSAEKRSGKTRVIEVCELLVREPLRTESISAAALARSVDAGRTLMLDEVDAIFGGKGASEVQEALRGILDSGYRVGGAYVRMAGAGGQMEPREYKTFGPKMLAGIGKLPGTLEDRCICVELRRKTANEPVERLRYRTAREQAEPIRQSLEDWGVSAIDVLREARPEIPDELDDRAQDAWEPLIAIADMAGGDWPKRVRIAAVALASGDTRDDESLGVRLLADIQDVMQGRDRIDSAGLTHALNALEEAPWGGRPLDPRSLARMLRPYGIRSHTVRVGNHTPKGYDRADFTDAWSRYLPCTGELSATSATRNWSQTGATSATDRHSSPDVADNHQTQFEMDVADVADQSRVNGGMAVESTNSDSPAVDEVEAELTRISTAAKGGAA